LNRDSADVAVDAPVVADLKIERPVAESLASLNAFGASYAQRLFDEIFVVGLFDEASLDGTRRAGLILGTRIKGDWSLCEETEAKTTVTTHGQVMDTLHC